MTMETIEGNKLIAEFMGLKTVKKLSPLSFEDVLFIKVYNDATKIWDNELPRYHSSWDWLMPIFQKIDKDSNAEWSIYWRGCTIKGPHESPPYIYGEADTTIEAVWIVVVKFIQWYNTTKPQPNG